MFKEIDIQAWNRREHFHFFSQFEEPFFGLVVDVDCTNAFKRSKELGVSYFLYSLHKILLAVNESEEFKYRIIDGKVICYDTIHVSPTVGREDGTFAFSFFNFYSDLNKFIAEASKEINRIKMSEGLQINEHTSRLDTIHFSSLPWIKFTGLTHARSFSYKDSVPKISVGKLFTENNNLKMPLSINVHHGLADGLHVSKFIDLLQAKLDS